MIIGLALGECTANSISDVESVMQQRFEHSFGAFWLSHYKSGFPMLNVLIRSDVSVLHFQDHESDHGFLSFGDMSNIDGQGTTEFAISKCEADNLIFPNKCLIPGALALEAAKEFFNSGARPKCVHWFENQ